MLEVMQLINLHRLKQLVKLKSNINNNKPVSHDNIKVIPLFDR